MSRGSKESHGIQVFPFLAVLICTMGSLIFLLLLTTRQARDRALNFAKYQRAQRLLAKQEAAAVAAAAESAALPPPIIPIPKPTPEPVAKSIPIPKRELVKPGKPRHEEYERTLAERERQLDELKRTWSQKAKQLAKARDHQRESLAQRQTQVKTTVEQAEAVKTEVESLEIKLGQLSNEAAAALLKAADDTEQRSIERQVAEMKRRLRAAQAKDAAGDNSKFQVVPFDPQTGTTRRPILIECTGTGIRFLPENITVTPDDLNGFTPRANPIAAGTGALINYWNASNSQQKNNRPESDPYVLLLVRPDGIVGYYVAMKMLEPIRTSHGYELIEESTVLQLPEVDPGAKAACQSSIQRLFAEKDQITRSDYKGGSGGGASGRGSQRGGSSGGTGPGGPGGSGGAGGTGGPGGKPGTGNSQGYGGGQLSERGGSAGNAFTMNDIADGEKNVGSRSWERIENFEGQPRGRRGSDSGNGFGSGPGNGVSGGNSGGGANNGTGGLGAPGLGNGGAGDAGGERVGVAGFAGDRAGNGGRGNAGGRAGSALDNPDGVLNPTEGGNGGGGGGGVGGLNGDPGVNGGGGRGGDSGGAFEGIGEADTGPGGSGPGGSGPGGSGPGGGGTESGRAKNVIDDPDAVLNSSDEGQPSGGNPSTQKSVFGMTRMPGESSAANGQSGGDGGGNSTGGGTANSSGAGSARSGGGSFVLPGGGNAGGAQRGGNGSASSNGQWSSKNGQPSNGSSDDYVQTEPGMPIGQRPNRKSKKSKQSSGSSTGGQAGDGDSDSSSDSGSGSGSGDGSESGPLSAKDRLLSTLNAGNTDPARHERRRRPSKPEEDANKQLEPEMLAGRRWGLAETGASIGFEREVRVEVMSDKFLIAERYEIPNGEQESKQEVFEHFVKALDKCSREWGRPPQGFFWTPRLKLIVKPDANAQYEQINTLMSRAGIATSREFSKTANSVQYGREPRWSKAATPKKDAEIRPGGAP